VTRNLIAEGLIEKPLNMIDIGGDGNLRVRLFEDEGAFGLESPDGVTVRMPKHISAGLAVKAAMLTAAALIREDRAIDIEVYDTRSGMGGSHTVSKVRHLMRDGDFLGIASRGDWWLCRIWYGRATSKAWEPWTEFDGFTLVAPDAWLSNERMMRIVG